MKPLKLTMTAFGPYKDSEVIDFTELKDNRLFVISGKTGAGKTTIFDGICFALYGSASGEDRSESKSLRSDFADDDVHTAVELEFELRGRYYRIKRQLGHIKKGNKTPTGERYEFYQKVNGREIPCVDRQIVTEINKKVEELLGLTKDQFIQIVMLPQGEFRKLLTSDTENKEEILRRIFKTERYTLITQRLRERKQSAEEDYRGEKQALDRFITEIAGMIPEREESELFQILSRNSYNAHQVLTGLEQEKDYYEQAVVRHKEHEQQAEIAYNKKLEEYHKAESLNEEFTNLERKQQELNGLLEQKSIYAHKEKQLESAERASRLDAYEEQVNNWRKDVSDKQGYLQTAKTAFEDAVKMREDAEIHYEQEEKKQAEREETNRQLERHQELLPIMTEIDKKRTALDKAYQELKGMKQKLDDGKIRKSQLSDAVVKLKEEVKEKEEKVDRLPEKVKKLSEMREMARVLYEYLNLYKKREELVKDGQRKRAEWEKAKHDYEEKESAWLNGQASVLAAHLHDGQPCPVCGSREHPNKAHGEEAVPTKEELEKVKTDFNQIDSLYRNAQSEYKIIQKQLDDKAKEVVQFGIEIENDQAGYDRLVKDGQALSNEVKGLEEERENLAKIREQLQRKEKEITNLEKHLEQLSNDYQDRKTSFATQKAVYEEQLKRVPEELRNLTELKKKINELQRLKESLEQAWKSAQEKLQQAQQEEVRAKANLENAGQQLKESIVKKERAEDQFLQALKESGFSGEENYRQAKMPDTVRRQLKAEIDDYHKTVASLELQIKDLRNKLKDKTKVDLGALDAEVKALKNAHEKAQDLCRRTEQFLEAIIKQAKKISDSYIQVEELEKRLNIVTDLYDVIRGQNSKKISFERYLQIEYLEQILVAANERLRKLSNGQFVLIRSDRQESRGRQSGLGLDVYDAYTGQTRDVKTLSGGEKFNASLSLALGMSDVIQSFQGGVSIDTMFIDEGFGSLDDESLTKAIDTLIDLQQSGRMIGVISHVQELKNTIPAVLEVYKMKEGYSRTKFAIK